MSLEERKQFDLAKQKEIKNCVVNEVLEKTGITRKDTKRERSEDALDSRVPS